MPGLLRGIARTAVVAGTATAVSGRVARRQAERNAGRDAHIYAEREAAYEQEVQAVQEPPPPSGAGESDTIAQLKDLADLKAQGILTDEELATEKAKILGG